MINLVVLRVRPLKEVRRVLGVRLRILAVEASFWFELVMLDLAAVGHEVVLVPDLFSSAMTHLIKVCLEHVYVANGKRGGTLELLNLVTVQLGLSHVGVFVVWKIVVHLALDVLSDLASHKLVELLFPSIIEIFSHSFKLTVHFEILQINTMIILF